MYYEKLLAITLALWVGIAAGAEAPSDFQERTGLLGTAKVGVNLIQGASNSNSDNRISFLGGLGAEYFFAPPIGLFAEGQFTSRGYKASSYSTTVQSSTNYIDVPFGIAFNPGRGIFSSYARSHFKLGGYFAQPLGDFKGDATYSSQSFFGLYVDNETTFAVSDHFSLGYTLWVKIPLGSAIKNYDSKFYEIGIGLTVAYF